MIGYHVTNYDNLQSILRNGLIPTANKIWAPSQDKVYFNSTNVLIINGTIEEEDAESKDFNIEDYEDDMIRHCKDQGQSCIAYSKSCKLAIIKFYISDEDDEDGEYSYESDNSCPGMTYAYQTHKTIEPKDFLDIFVSNDLSAFKNFFIAAYYLHPNATLIENPKNKIVWDLYKDAYEKMNHDLYYDYCEFSKLTNEELLSMSFIQ